MNKDMKYMIWAMHGAKLFTRCAKRQYMAIITSPQGRVIGTGYNGAPSGMKECTDGGCPRFLEGAEAGSNYDRCVSVHAEENALLFSDFQARQGGTLYVNGPPCFGCAKKIANSGLKRLVYIADDSYADWPRVQTFLETAGIELNNLGWNFTDLDLIDGSDNASRP